MSKISQARDIYQELGYDGTPVSRAAIVTALMDQLDISRGNASTYFSNCKKALGEVDSKVAVPMPSDDNLTDEEIAERIETRFAIMRKMTRGMITKGDLLRALVVEGAPGIGKTYDIEKILESAEEKGYLDAGYDLISGSATAAGLYNTLWRNRNGGIVVLDDCDVWSDEEALNLLKKALDTGKKRLLSWNKKSSWVYDARAKENAGLGGDADEIDRIPNIFEFKGGVIFLTNVDLKAGMLSNKKNAVHYQAIVDRSSYIDLTLKTPRDKIIRMRSVWYGGMYKDAGLTKAEAVDVMTYVEDNQSRFYQLSLRTLGFAANYLVISRDEKDKDGWKMMLEVTKMKNK